jgi:hypothetical protein
MITCRFVVSSSCSTAIYMRNRPHHGSVYSRPGVKITATPSGNRILGSRSGTPVSGCRVIHSQNLGWSKMVSWIGSGRTGKTLKIILMTGRNSEPLGTTGLKQAVWPRFLSFYPLLSASIFLQCQIILRLFTHEILL